METGDKKSRVHEPLLPPRRELSVEDPTYLEVTALELQSESDYTEELSAFETHLK